MAHRLGHPLSDIHYCYQCFDWVVDEEWESHCQSYLAGMATKRCGTVTYCHTLVRPGYCPFCMSDPKLLASQRLESWTRDHLSRCRWPRVCPHPLCDTSLKDAAALQFHLVDEHGFSRTYPWKSASGTAVDSQDETTTLDQDPQRDRPSRKRKSSSGIGALEWIPPQSFHDTPFSPGGPTSCRPLKRPRQTPSSICPSVLSLNEDLSDDQIAPHLMDSAMLSSPCSLSIDRDDSHTDFGCQLSPSRGRTADNTIDLEDVDGGSNFDTLFDQYLRSPSTSPSPTIRPAYLAEPR